MSSKQWQACLSGFERHVNNLVEKPRTCSRWPRIKYFQTHWRSPKTVFQLCATLPRFTSCDMFSVFWDFNQLYIEAPYGIIPTIVSSLCCWIGFAHITPILIIRTWWIAGVFSRTLTVLVILLWTHSNLSFLKHAIRCNHHILGIHWKMQKWMQTFFSFLYSWYEKAIKAARGSANLLSNPILLLVHGICGHFLGVESNLQGS